MGIEKLTLATGPLLSRKPGDPEESVLPVSGDSRQRTEPDASCRWRELDRDGKCAGHGVVRHPRL